MFNALRVFGVTERSLVNPTKKRGRGVQDAEAIFASYAFSHLRDKGMLKLDAYKVIAEILKLSPTSIKPCLNRYEALMEVDSDFRHKNMIYEKELAKLDRRSRIYFGRALPNWGVVVSHQGIRRGAATLSTQESHPFRGESMSIDKEKVASDMKFNFYKDYIGYRYDHRSCANCAGCRSCIAMAGKDFSTPWLDLGKCGCRLYHGEYDDEPQFKDIDYYAVGL